MLVLLHDAQSFVAMRTQENKIVRSLRVYYRDLEVDRVVLSIVQELFRIRKRSSEHVARNFDNTVRFFEGVLTHVEMMWRHRKK